ncbi:hypothetical protein CONCODRAFT_87512 [Conidiobolus coronatus NRRL 28638]|uniref:Nudix hydrolase domain-containing protein n=1 Tax=Conidiobolus coronatus (strain ATCC 28846 / CBS 209.66 / NRRL 28638) TaxID=796925 RepID=A0A137NU74_CONC2|nr:hypothetical protein CONCODRAFT_87512 [Conidiobolus coronatus NRRL 28638]|eukprot:KXN66309.1 hypothetical protein CONCODRAFT_87512 [Conidiobolus coronatus NRRL 28638]
MLKRPKQGTFSGMTVFPGGAVDKADNEENFQLLNTKSQIKERPSELTQFKLSSIRETFEETGILITDKQPSLTQDELTKYRAEIINQPSEFINFLNEFNLTPQIDNLHAVSRWITPAYMKRRFDTVFFAHILNGKEQLASLNNSEGYQEAVQLNWETPKDWLLQQSSEEVDFMPPQFYFCQLLNNNLKTLKTLQDHLNYNNSAKSTTEETMLSGYLPNHIKIETSNIDLTAYNISLPPDYNLFYTILPGDSQYDKLQNSSIGYQKQVWTYENVEIIN